MICRRNRYNRCLFLICYAQDSGKENQTDRASSSLGFSRIEMETKLKATEQARLQLEQTVDRLTTEVETLQTQVAKYFQRMAAMLMAQLNATAQAISSAD